MAEDWNGVAKKAGFNDEKAMLTTMYLEEELSVSTIAKRLNYGIATIASRLSKHGIPKRSRGGPNNHHRVTRLLFRMDQRVVFGKSSGELARMLGVHESTVYKYKREIQRRAE